jgi:hypothetical protein
MKHARGLLSTCLVMALVAGCAHGPVPDPREADRARLLSLETTPLAADFPAEARIVLSPALLAAEVQRSLDEGARVVEAFRVPVPLLGEIAIRPTVVVRRVTAHAAAGCVDCVALAVDLEGVLAPVTTSKLWPGLRFAGVARGVFAVQMVDQAQEGVVVVRATATAATATAAHADDASDTGWRVDIELLDLPFESSRQGWLSSSLTAMLQRAVGREKPPELSLATLPREGPVRLRGLRPGARDGAVVLDVAFVAIDSDVVDDGLPAVTEGFAVQIPEATLLALARAHTLRLPPDDGWVVDPTRLVVDDDRFGLDLAVFRLTGRGERRDLHVDGRLHLDDTGLTIEPTKASQEAFHGFDPFEFVVRVALLERVQQALRLTIPVTPADGPSRVRLVRSVDRGATLQLEGIVEAPVR